jgi:2,4-dienoyl-CoA reductase-like NADH-dependent reductase (Old Yellow Enzyme family)
MTDTRFPHLLEPGRIGPMTVRNRVLMAPMGDRLAHDDGTVSERQAAYLEARARGGVGVVMIGSVAVSYPTGAYAPCQTAISEDRFVAGLRSLTERVHRHGARLVAQLVHDGPNSLFDIAEGRPMLVPSIPPRLRPDRLSAMVTPTELDAMIRPFTGPRSATSYRLADEDDLALVIEQFADAADRARAAGLDGVEIHGGHGYLIDAFLSRATNQRDDRWGGDVVGRARLLVEVLAAVRARVGDDLAVWCRLNALERFRVDGETPDDLLEVAQLAVAAGTDAIHVSAATDAGAALGVTEAHTPHEPELLVPFAAMVKAIVAVPVITVGRIEPEAAEAALERGDADFVAMGRALLADPDLVRKLAEGRIDDVRPCIYQYRCIGNIFLGESVACVANPATAHGDAESLPPSAAPRRVLVVGAGPAGLEAARLLAQRGHRVVLADAADRLGGTLVSAARTDTVLDHFLGWQTRQVALADIDVRLGTPIRAETIAALGVDEIVAATGGRWTRPDRPGVDLPHVVTVGELGPWLETADERVASPVVIIGGGKAGLSVALLCADRGHDVTVIEAGSVFAPELGPPGRFRLVHQAEGAGITLRPDAALTAITAGSPGHLGQVHWQTGTDTGSTDARTVILTELAPAAEVADAFRATGLAVHVIGDAGTIGGIEGALADARALAVDLG